MSTVKMFKGLAPNLHEGAWEYAEEMVKNDSNLCIVPDLESGFPVVMTTKERDGLVDIWEACKPKLNDDFRHKGTIIYFGTSGDNSKKFNDEYK